jgi:hypothetical protein
MRHPFDGINRSDTTSLPTKPHRRSVLRWLATASALLVAPLKFVRSAAADDAPAGESESEAALEAKRERVDQFRQYFVVAVNSQGFGMARRKKLGIPGSYQEGWPSRPELRKTRGYVAWMTAEQAEQLKNEPAISAVHELAAGDTIVSGQPSTGPAEIIVSLYPNGFRDKAQDDSFFTNKELLSTLSKELSSHENVQAVTGMKGYKLYIWIKNGDVPPDLLTALKENAQVYHVNFTGRQTTMMLGEEGGRPPGNVR